MKPIKIKYGKDKEILITRDFFKVGIGIIILIADSLIAGVVQLFEFGFDMSYLFTSEFWTPYSIKLIISYVALFGAYIIRKTKNKRSPKFVVQREKIKECKQNIVKNRKIGASKNWLKYVLNYRRKVERYQNLITRKYEKLVSTEPEEPNKEDFNIESRFGKFKYKRAILKYNKKHNTYLKTEEMRKFYEQQLAVCEIHFEIINCYRKHNMVKVKELQQQIKDIDCMKNYNLHYKPITYNRLFNIDLGNVKQDDGIEYNETGFLFKRILPSIFGGLISVALLTSIIVTRKSFTQETILLIVLNLMLMAWFCLTGIRFADGFIFGTVYAADTNRIMICEEFLEDCALNGDNWTENIDTSEEPIIEELDAPNEIEEQKQEDVNNLQQSTSSDVKQIG